MIDINTPKEYEQHVANGSKVLLDFWAPWCGPCRAMMPTLEKLKEENPDLTIAKVNIDENQALAATFRIRSVPYLVYLKDGNPVQASAGQKDLTQLRQLIAS